MTPVNYGLAFHHLGLAVRVPETAAKFLTGLGYRVEELVHDQSQRVRVGMCHGQGGMPDIELVTPVEGGGPLDNLLKRQDSMLYHMCYLSADPAASVAAMRADGLHVLDLLDPTPAVLFHGRPVSFHHVLNVGLIELLQA